MFLNLFLTRLECWSITAKNELNMPFYIFKHPCFWLVWISFMASLLLSSFGNYCLSSPSWQYFIDFLRVKFQTVCWPIKHRCIMVITTAFGYLGGMGRCQYLLGNEIGISKKPVSWRKTEVLVDGWFTLNFRKCNGTTPNSDLLFLIN